MNVHVFQHLLSQIFQIFLEPISVFFFIPHSQLEEQQQQQRKIQKVLFFFICNTHFLTGKSNQKKHGSPQLQPFAVAAVCLLIYHSYSSSWFCSQFFFILVYLLSEVVPSPSCESDFWSFLHFYRIISTLTGTQHCHMATSLPHCSLMAGLTEHQRSLYFLLFPFYVNLHVKQISRTAFFY